MPTASQYSTVLIRMGLFAAALVLEPACARSQHARSTIRSGDEAPPVTAVVNQPVEPRKQVAVDPRIAKMDKLFAPWDRSDGPGCALAVVENGNIVYKRGYGTANLEHGISLAPDSVFYIASTSKQFTAASIALLAEQGKLSLDDGLKKHIPELPAVYDGVTIRQLVHHTSGIPDYLSLMTLGGILAEDVFTDEDVIELLSRQKRLMFKPGEKHAYTNSGYVLLAIVVKRATGKSLRQFAAEAIFTPLGMTSTVFRDDRTLVVKKLAGGYQTGRDGGWHALVSNFDRVGDGGLLSTVEDLYRWDQNFYDNKLGGGTQFIELLETPGTLQSGEKLSYAFGLMVDQYRGLKTVSHGGAFAAFQAGMIRFPDQKFSVICLCNVITAPAGRLAQQIADIYLADRLKAEAPSTPPTDGPIIKVTDEELKKRTGMYRSIESGSVVKLSLQGGKLMGETSGITFELAPLTPLRFVFQNAPFRAIVEFAAADPGRRSGAQLLVAGRPPMRLEPIESVPSENLEQYVGEYFSEELRSTWRVRLDQDQRELWVKVGKNEEVKLRPTLKDEFSVQIATLKFLRDRRHRISGITVNAGRAGAELVKVRAKQASR